MLSSVNPSVLSFVTKNSTRYTTGAASLFAAPAWTVWPYCLYQHAATCYQTDKTPPSQGARKTARCPPGDKLASVHRAEVYLLDGGCISDGVDSAIRAQHPAMLVRDNAPEMRLGALWKPVLHTQRPSSLQTLSVKLPTCRLPLHTLLPLLHRTCYANSRWQRTFMS